MSCEVDSVLCERERIFFVLLYSEVGGNERIRCRWISLWDGDLGSFFCPFRTEFLGQDGRYGCVDGCVG